MAQKTRQGLNAQRAVIDAASLLLAVEEAPPSEVGDAIRMEDDSGFILMENGDRILME